MLDVSASTLDHVAFALHYASVIILIEKLASSPHLIHLDARDDLYNLLPATIKSSLRAKLKTFSRTPASYFYDAACAETGLWSNVHLVQTLYFTNRVETEAAIVELLMSLNSPEACSQSLELPRTRLHVWSSMRSALMTSEAPQDLSSGLELYEVCSHDIRSFPRDRDLPSGLELHEVCLHDLKVQRLRGPEASRSTSQGPEFQRPRGRCPEVQKPRGSEASTKFEQDS
ncbi:hypothetical protein C2S51_031149 [Perilla frutescens var. frutescens]|nr:hypothetical protein C2S51_031149 [Perilla frutescens var. frutescens]